MTDLAGGVRGVAQPPKCRADAAQMQRDRAARKFRPRDTPPLLGVPGEPIDREMRGGIDCDGRAGSTLGAARADGKKKPRRSGAR
jgi:hypothetical protein